MELRITQDGKIIRKCGQCPNFRKVDGEYYCKPLKEKYGWTPGSKNDSFGINCWLEPLKMICPECGAEMVLRKTNKFKYGDGQDRYFYGCSRFPNCKAVHGAHPDGLPFGFPADKKTKELRQQAHRKMEELQKLGAFSTQEVYKIVQQTMNMNEFQAHIGRFNIEQCKKLIRNFDVLIKQMEAE